MKKILILILLSSLTAGLQAQDILTTPLKWVVTKITDNQTQELMNFQCTFESQSNSIKWIQKNGSYVTSFSINSVQGTWSDVKSIGEVTYSVTLDGQTGTLKFWRDASGAYITINLPQAGMDAIWYTYSISQVAIIN